MFKEEDLRKLETLPNAVENAFAEGVKELALLGQEQMAHNVSGRSVSFSGGSFTINVQTGNLRRQIRAEYPLGGNRFEAAVFNRAPYAELLEYGISGEQTKQMILNGGKPAKISKAGVPYKTIPGTGGRFWTVTGESQLKSQQARPFAKATAEQLDESAESVLEQAFEEAMGSLS